jgi:phage gp36-like protein
VADPYLTLAEYALYSLLPAAYSTVSDAVKTARISSRSRWADGYLGQQFDLPLSAWDDDLRAAVAMAVDWDVMSYRGFNPEANADRVVLLRYEQAEAWFANVANGKITPYVTDASSGAGPGDSTAGPIVVTSPMRGWSSRGTDREDARFTGGSGD